MGPWYSPLAAILVGVFAIPSAATVLVDTISSIASNDSSVGQFVSSSTGFDAPKVSPINSTSFDWWYFDAVAPGLGYSVVFDFLAAPGGSFPTQLPDDSILAVSVFVTSPTVNNSWTTLPSEAVVVTVGDGASGDWEGSGFAFSGTPDLSSYQITASSSELDIYGTVVFKSIAPPHYPAGPAVKGQSLELIPGVGWANAIPDAVTHVDLMINGSEVKFTGVGYHDKNWGISPAEDNVASWYWGHGRLGPYSIVWFDALTPDGVEYVSGYVAKDGEILFVQNSGVKVRPVGSSYPPSTGDVPDSFTISIDIDTRDTLEINTTMIEILDEESFYYRWLINLTGTFRGESYSGTGVMEEILFS